MTCALCGHAIDEQDCDYGTVTLSDVVDQEVHLCRGEGDHDCYRLWLVEGVRP